MSFYTDVLQKSPVYHSPNRVSDLQWLEPVTRAAVIAILADAREAGTPLMVFETYRSPLRQQMLYNQGATQLRTVGTHGYGLAADLVKDVGGEPSWKGCFSFLGRLAKKHGLVWGGDWGQSGPHNFIDADHLQRIAVADQSKLFTLAWYPDDAYTAVA